MIRRASPHLEISTLPGAVVPSCVAQDCFLVAVFCCSQGTTARSNCVGQAPTAPCVSQNQARANAGRNQASNKSTLARAFQVVAAGTGALEALGRVLRDNAARADVQQEALRAMANICGTALPLSATAQSKARPGFGPVSAEGSPQQLTEAGNSEISSAL